VVLTVPWSFTHCWPSCASRIFLFLKSPSRFPPLPPQPRAEKDVLEFLLLLFFSRFPFSLTFSHIFPPIPRERAHEIGDVWSTDIFRQVFSRPISICVHPVIRTFFRWKPLAPPCFPRTPWNFFFPFPLEPPPCRKVRRGPWVVKAACRSVSSVPFFRLPFSGVQRHLRVATWGAPLVGQTDGWSTIPPAQPPSLPRCGSSFSCHSWPFSNMVYVTNAPRAVFPSPESSPSLLQYEISYSLRPRPRYGYVGTMFLRAKGALFLVFLSFSSLVFFWFDEFFS